MTSYKPIDTPVYSGWYDFLQTNWYSSFYFESYHTTRCFVF
jgi:hypothetical protein